MKKRNLCLAFSITMLCGTLFYGNSCTKTNTKTVVDTVDVVPVNPIAVHINDSLWGYFPIDGSTADSSGHGHVLTLGGSAILSNDTWGNPGGAIDLNSGGTGDYAIIPDGTNFVSDSLSVSMFVMPRANSGFFFAKVDYNTGLGASLNLGIDPRNFLDTLRLSITANQSAICSAPAAGGFLIKDGTQLVPNAWYHVVATFAAGVESLYVNGVLIGSSTISLQALNNCSAAQFVFGNWWAQDNGPAFNGKIDEIRIYSRAISAAEVSYLFANYKK